MIFITVLIPAFNRPELLRLALQSIDKQTAKAAIRRVIVSENGLNADSKLVCDEFTDLPIEYVFQQPQLPVLAHLKWLMSQEQQGYVALLCDDDWWNPYHLEIAIRSLEQHPTCVAYFSNFIYADSEVGLNSQLYHGLKGLHIGQSDFSNAALNKYNQQNILVLTTLITPFHFSAMVCEGSILSKAVEIFDSIHPTYADRILWAVLSSYGELLFNPLHTSVVLLHEEMDSRRYSSIEWKEKAQEGSLRIIDLAETQGYAIKEAINLAYEVASAKDAEFMREAY
ncbi:MAG: glycosyltransferase family 2 protein, partial [Sphingobacteriaceae bacterium]